MSRPEYVKCVNTGHRDETKSWCGREPDGFEWRFVDATHAALSGRNGDRLVACPKCVRAIVKALRNGS